MIRARSALAAILSLFHPFTTASADCSRTVLTQMFQGQPIEVTDLRSIRDRHLLELNRAFGKENEIVFGIQSSNEHAYLMAGDVRYDGEILFHKGKIRRTNVLTDGVVIRFKDLPPETVEKFREHLLSLEGKNNRSISCFSGACTQLKKAGIHLEGNPILPTDIFKKIFKDGFVDSNGKAIPIEIYQTDGVYLNNHFSDLKFSQSSDLMYYGGGTGLMAFLLGGTLYLSTKPVKKLGPVASPTPSFKK